MRSTIVCLGLLAAVLVSTPALAQKGVPATTVYVGGYAMASDHDIVDNLAQSHDHVTFVALLRATGLFEPLRGHGPFTVFAPTDTAFASLPPDLLETLRRPENKARLLALMSLHVLPGNFSSARLRYLLRSNKGSVELDTLGNGSITAFTNGPSNIGLRDAKGTVAAITLYDAKQANGVVFVTDRVLQPG